MLRQTCLIRTTTFADVAAAVDFVSVVSTAPAGLHHFQVRRGVLYFALLAPLLILPILTGPSMLMLRLAAERWLEGWLRRRQRADNDSLLVDAVEC
jgi:hypothetical protein